LRLGQRSHPDDGGPRRRSLGTERHQDLLHERAHGGRSREVERLHRRLGDRSTARRAAPASSRSSSMPARPA
jgi:hypothetical protein